MNGLNWIGQHPILTIVLLIVVEAIVVDVIQAVRK